MTKADTPPLREHLIGCECHGNHFLAFSYWPGTGTDIMAEGQISAGGNFAATWRQRLAAIWWVLTKGKSLTDVSVVLDPEKALALAGHLMEFAADRTKVKLAEEPTEPPAPEGEHSHTTSADARPASDSPA